MIPEKLKAKFSKIKLLVMDVDGTLTDGTLYYSEEGISLKPFYTPDGLGVILLHKYGFKTAIISGNNSLIIMKRAERLGIKNVVLDSRDKTSELLKLIEKLNISLDEVAYIGDDVNDYPIMQKVGLSCCPADAQMAILKTTDYVCKKNGGRGAVREVTDMMLFAQGKPLIVEENW